MKNIVKKAAAKAGLLTLLFALPVGVESQVHILSSQFTGYNVSALGLCGLNISSANGEASAYIEASITNMQGAVVMQVKSNPFSLKSGVNNSLQNGLTVASSHYQSSAVSEYIRSYHQLPSGKYNYCVSVKLSNGNGGDELCDEIESEGSTYLTLINPFDKDTISSFNPVLVWNHSESFSVIQQGEFYRMVICEIKPDQSADAAININNALYQYNYLTRHDALYPIDAPKLEAGKRYAWQVQKVVNGIITNKTEAWEFVLKSEKNNEAKTFVEITPRLNVSPYKVENDRIYFVFKEEYAKDGGEMRLFISDGSSAEQTVKANAYSEPGLKKEELSKIQQNRYSVDLKELGLKDGIYVLKILNQKNQEFLLKFKYNAL